MTIQQTPRRAGGFTLIEAIIVIAITGILAAMVAIFIRVPVKSYVDVAARAAMSDTADVALRRVSREVRLALPNSVQVGPNFLQFLVTKTGARYIDASDQPPSTLEVLDFNNSAKLQFDMVPPVPSGRQAIRVNDYVVVYNLGNGSSNAYTGGNIARINGVNGTRITLASNPFAALGTTGQSPTQRFQVVTGTVTYVCTPRADGTGVMTRFYTDAIVNGANAALGVGHPLAGMVAGCDFRVSSLANQISTLLTMRLTLRHRSGEQVQLMRQVRVDNTP